MRSTLSAVHLLLPLCLLLTAAGCARHEYAIVEPPEFAQHIPHGQQNRVHIEWTPMQYSFQSYENRLVMWVHNPIDEPVELLGAQSFVVSPDGQSHPLRSLSIAPDSHIRMIMPPTRPIQPSPRLGVGVGVGMGRGRVGTGVGTGIGYSPRGTHYPSTWPGETFWTWDGQTPVRMRLTYRIGEQTIAHQFLFQRVRM